jgi:hypothetical protein
MSQLEAAERGPTKVQRQAGDDPSGEKADLVTERPTTYERRLVIVLVAAVVLPLVVAAIAVRSPRWYPIGDTAMLELRVRDVGTRHTTLIGLPGRINAGDMQGSHPGPLSFYALAIPYRLLGSSAWALQAATFTLHALAAAVSVLIGYRRGGLRVAALVALMMSAVVWAYGFTILTNPWNPYLPILWWIVVLLAVWSVTCRDIAMLPVAVVAGSFCAQTHVSYLGMTIGLGVLVAVVVVLSLRAQPRGSPSRRYAASWSGCAFGLGFLLWLPPILDEVDKSPGNLVILWKHFTNPDEPPLGLSKAIESVASHFDPLWFVHAETGVQHGRLFLAVWVISGLLAWRIKAQDWLRLHLVLGVALVLSAYSVSRVFGPNWYYLSLWAWGLMAVGSLAIVGTLWTAVEDRASWWRHAVVRRLGPVIVALTVAVALVGSIGDATDVMPPEERVWTELGLLAGPTKAALQAGHGAATGTDGRYLVTWQDPMLFGSQGYGLLDELERAGFDVGVPKTERVSAVPYRIRSAGDATAIVHLATGGFVDSTRALPGNVEVVTLDSRTFEERKEFATLRSEVVAGLEQAGLQDLVALVDANLFAAGGDERMPNALRPKVSRMFELGQEVAVFILPPDAFG